MCSVCARTAHPLGGWRADERNRHYARVPMTQSDFVASLVAAVPHTQPIVDEHLRDYDGGLLRRSRLHDLTVPSSARISTSSTGTRQACSFSVRSCHHESSGFNSSNFKGLVLLYRFMPGGGVTLVIPDLPRRPCAVEEEQVGWVEV